MNCNGMRGQNTSCSISEDDKLMFVATCFQGAGFEGYGMHVIDMYRKMEGEDGGIYQARSSDLVVRARSHTLEIPSILQ